jgi:two-component system response regulator YesN
MTLFRILIIDDEALIRQGLRKTIAQYFENACLIEEAENGIAALEKIKAAPYDLVITDIKMPLMDGLELIERIRATDADLALIIISGYDDFAYAKRAIKFGVTDYLLKPIDSDELLGIIRKTIEKRQARLADFEGKNEYILISNVLKKLIFGNADQASIAGQVNLIAAKFSREYFYSAVSSLPGLSADVDIRRIIQSFAVQLNADNRRNSFLFENRPGELVCLINCNEADLRIIQADLHRIYELFKTQFGLIINIGLSTCFRSLKGMKDGYHEASAALMLKLYQSDAAVFTAGESAAFAPLSKINTAAFSRDFSGSLAIGDREAAIKIMRKFFTELSQAYYDPAEILRIFDSLLVRIRQEIGKTDQIAVSVVDDYLDRLEVTGRCCSMRELQDLLLQATVEILGIMAAKKDDECRKIIEFAKEFIRSNCCGELSLKAVAEQALMSPAYFSYLFKKETGLNFVDYTTAIKMEKAKELLAANPELKIYEIADQLGYKDVKYFNRIFKKFYTLTPGEYREKCNLIPLQ